MAVGDPREFDEWAERYDASVQGRDGFPFGGYDLVLRRAVELAAVQPQSSVLDLGIGTGNLARHFVELGCPVWGIDFSPGMLAHAQARLPGVPLARADVLGSWPTEFRRRYDRVVSAYVFHHFDQAEKVDLLVRLSRDCMAIGGKVIVADIAFGTSQALDDARIRWADTWDEEHFWVAEQDLPACEKAGLHVRYEQVTDFAAVMVVQPSSPGRAGPLRPPGDGGRAA